MHKLWGDLYEQRCLYPEAVEEYRAAQLIARQDADASTDPTRVFFAADDRRFGGLEAIGCFLEENNRCL